VGPSDLEEYLLEEPFIPIRLVLASGDHLLIRHRSEALVTGMTLFLGRSIEAARAPGHYRMVSIPNIVYAERSPPLPLQHGRRGR
jgi:hypothetical protein